ncbi:MAG: hypothetical protein Aurels2KO_16470 [Aureliella sp.]
MQNKSLRSIASVCLGLMCASSAFAGWGSSGGYYGSSGGYRAAYGSSGGYSAGYSSYGSSGGYSVGYASSGGSSGYYQPGPIRRLAGAIHNHMAAKHARWSARRAYYGSSGSSYGSSGGYSASYGSSGSYYRASYGSSGGYSSSYGSSGGYSASYGSSGGYTSSYQGYSTGGSSGGSVSYGSTGGVSTSYYGASNISVPSSMILATASQAVGESVQLTVSVPTDAKIFVNGNPTTSTGAVRQFVSHGLVAGKEYRFKIRAELAAADGQTLTEEKDVVVNAGGLQHVEFAFNDHADAAIETAVTLNVPEGAQVRLAGSDTSIAGNERTYRTSRMKLGEVWDNYEIEVTHNGLTKRQNIRLIAGDRIEMTFDFGASADRIAMAD